MTQTRTLLRTPLIALAAIATLAVALIASSPADAAKLGGKTLLKPEASTFEALTEAGVSVAPSGKAKANNNGIVFPITSGKLNLDKTTGKVKHTGGLTFTGHGASLTVEDFVVKVGKKSSITAKAGGSSIKLADLDLSKAKIKEKGDEVVISKVKVLLAGEAADALSATFGLPDLEGADLGEAVVKVKP